MNRVHAVLWMVAAAGLTCAAGCVDSARIKGDNEAVLVDQKNAGTVVYDSIVKEAVEELLQKHHDKVVNSGKKFLVAFIGIENKGFEELRDHEEAIYDQVEEVLVNAGYYRSISKRYIDTARREAGLRDANDLFLRDKKAAFDAVLQKEGLTPDYLMYGKVTTQTDEHKGLISKSRERRYSYSMEMIDARSGETVTKTSGQKSKAYTNW